MADLLESDSLYKILKQTRFGVPTGRYIAFLPRVGKRPQIIAQCGSAREARAACEEHARFRGTGLA